MSEAGEQGNDPLPAANFSWNSPVASPSIPKDSKLIPPDNQGSDNSGGSASFCTFGALGQPTPPVPAETSPDSSLAAAVAGKSMEGSDGDQGLLPAKTLPDCSPAAAVDKSMEGSDDNQDSLPGKTLTDCPLAGAVDKSMEDSDDGQDSQPAAILADCPLAAAVVKSMEDSDGDQDSLPVETLPDCTLAATVDKSMEDSDGDRVLLPAETLPDCTLAATVDKWMEDSDDDRVLLPAKTLTDCPLVAAVDKSMEGPDDNMGLNSGFPQQIPSNLPGHATFLENGLQEGSGYSLTRCRSILNASTDDFLGRQQCGSQSSGFSPTEEAAERRITRVGAGLFNLGNSCFINSVLQCITHTVPLILLLERYKHRECNVDGFCVLCCLRDHIEKALNHSGGIISPRNLFNNLNHISPYFQKYQEEDAHEFLQSILDKLEITSQDSNTGDNNPSINITEQLFGGRLVSRLSCGKCGSCSYTYEPSIILSLEIENVDDLANALESFTDVEKLQDELACDSCQEKVPKYKQLMLDQPPLVATFHLKRFENDGMSVSKIYKHVEFPLELDMEPYTIKRQGDNVVTKYYLYAYVEHGGSLTSGHYFSYVRSAPNTWHKLDDSVVDRVSEEDVLSGHAYILFYVREGTPWFSSIFQQMKPFTESSPKSVLDGVADDLTFDEGAEIGGAATEPRNIVEETPSVSSQGHEKGVDANEPKKSISASKQTEGDVLMNGTSVKVESCREFRTNPSQGFGHVAASPKCRSPDHSPSRSCRHERSYRIIRGHLKVGKNEQLKSKVEIHQPLKRKLLKRAGEDENRAIARRYLLKNVPSARAALLSAAMGCQTPGSLAKRQRKKLSQLEQKAPSSCPPAG